MRKSLRSLFLSGCPVIQSGDGDVVVDMGLKMDFRGLCNIFICLHVVTVSVSPYTS